MAKYIRCSRCGKRIDFSEPIFKFPGYCGIYCSEYCFTDTYADCIELDEDVAMSACAQICDDDEDKRKLQADIAKAEEQIRELERQLKLNKVLLTQYD